MDRSKNILKPYGFCGKNRSKMALSWIRARIESGEPVYSPAFAKKNTMPASKLLVELRAADFVTPFYMISRDVLLTHILPYLDWPSVIALAKTCRLLYSWIMHVVRMGAPRYFAHETATPACFSCQYDMSRLIRRMTENGETCKTMDSRLAVLLNVPVSVIETVRRQHHGRSIDEWTRDLVKTALARNGIIHQVERNRIARQCFEVAEREFSEARAKTRTDALLDWMDHESPFYGSGRKNRLILEALWPHIYTIFARQLNNISQRPLLKDGDLDGSDVRPIQLALQRVPPTLLRYLVHVYLEICAMPKRPSFFIVTLIGVAVRILSHPTEMEAFMRWIMDVGAIKTLDAVPPISAAVFVHFCWHQRGYLRYGISHEPDFNAMDKHRGRTTFMTHHPHKQTPVYAIFHVK